MANSKENLHLDDTKAAREFFKHTAGVKTMNELSFKEVTDSEGQHICNFVTGKHHETGAKTKCLVSKKVKAPSGGIPTLAWLENLEVSWYTIDGDDETEDQSIWLLHNHQDDGIAGSADEEL